MSEQPTPEQNKQVEAAIKRFQDERDSKPNPLKPEPAKEEGRHART